MKKEIASYVRMAGGLVGCVVIVALLNGGCATVSPGGGGAVTEVVAVEDVASHAIHSEALAASMQELKRLSSLSSIAGMYNDSEVDLDVSGAAEAAEKIAEAAKSLPSALGEIEISEENKAKFLELVDALAGNATLLSSQAKANDLESAKVTAKALKQTCTDCHGLYRTN